MFFVSNISSKKVYLRSGYEAKLLHAWLSGYTKKSWISAQTAALLQAVWDILDKSPINDCKKGWSKREAQANLIRFLPRLMTHITAEFIGQTDQGSIVQETDWKSASLHLKGLFKLRVIRWKE